MQISGGVDRVGVRGVLAAFAIGAMLVFPALVRAEDNTPRLERELALVLAERVAPTRAALEALRKTFDAPETPWAAEPNATPEAAPSAAAEAAPPAAADALVTTLDAALEATLATTARLPLDETDAPAAARGAATRQLHVLARRAAALDRARKALISRGEPEAGAGRALADTLAVTADLIASATAWIGLAELDAHIAADTGLEAALAATPGAMRGTDTALIQLRELAARRVADARAARDALASGDWTADTETFAAPPEGDTGGAYTSRWRTLQEDLGEPLAAPLPAVPALVAALDARNHWLAAVGPARAALRDERALLDEIAPLALLADNAELSPAHRASLALTLGDRLDALVDVETALAPTLIAVLAEEGASPEREILREVLRAASDAVSEPLGTITVALEVGHPVWLEVDALVREVASARAARLAHIRDALPTAGDVLAGAVHAEFANRARRTAHEHAGAVRATTGPIEEALVAPGLGGQPVSARTSAVAWLQRALGLLSDAERLERYAITAADTKRAPSERGEALLVLAELLRLPWRAEIDGSRVRIDVGIGGRSFAMRDIATLGPIPAPTSAYPGAYTSCLLDACDASWIETSAGFAAVRAAATRAGQLPPFPPATPPPATTAATTNTPPVTAGPVHPADIARLDALVSAERRRAARALAERIRFASEPLESGKDADPEASADTWRSRRGEIAGQSRARLGLSD